MNTANRNGGRETTPDTKRKAMNKKRNITYKKIEKPKVFVCCCSNCWHISMHGHYCDLNGFPITYPEENKCKNYRR